jgi:hypothetical protein
MQFFSRTLIVLATLSISTALRASDIPNCVPERWCKEVSDASGGSEVIYGGCMSQEQDAYDALKQSWTDAPSKTKAFKEVAKSSGSGSYGILKGCIDQEATAREENSTRQFKR